MKPVEYPNIADIHKAVEILQQQHLHIYQVLYFNKLTDPNGFPLTVERITNNGQVSQGVKVYLKNNQSKGLYFDIYRNISDDELLEKSRMLIAGIDKVKVDPRACCVYATIRPCVCLISFQCPLHHSMCIGTHD